MRLMVIAGTPIDTKMGCTLLKNHGYQDLIPISVSESPSEQTFFQISCQEKRNEHISMYLLEAKKQKCDLVIVYCNSLSASVDFEKLSTKLSIKIITPFFVYKKLATSHQKVGLLSANAQGLSGIEREMIGVNKTLEICAVASIDWVKDIEKKINPSLLMQKSGLKETIALFEKNKVEVIIFGCTHFPYFLKNYQEQTNIKCVNPDEEMLKQISQFEKINKKSGR